MRRPRPLNTLVVALALVACGVYFLWPRPSQVTRENYDRIQPGMSLAEVKAILGPAGDYQTGPAGSISYMDGRSNRVGGVPIDMMHGERGLNWVTDTALVIVIIDPSDHVRDKSFFLCVPKECSGFERLRWRAWRQWLRWFPPG